MPGSRFKPGMKVIVSSTLEQYNGQTGTVVELKGAPIDTSLCRLVQFDDPSLGFRNVRLTSMKVVRDLQLI